MIKKIGIGFAVLVVVFAVAFGGHLYRLGKKSPSVVNENIGVANGHLKACGDKPNCVSSTSEPHSDLYIEPLVAENIQVLWDDLIMLLEDLSKNEKDYKVVSIDSNYIHILAISKIFGFVDDVEFLLRPAEGIIEIRSQSRVGYSDLGANRKRLEKIRKLLQPKS